MRVDSIDSPDFDLPRFISASTAAELAILAIVGGYTYYFGIGTETLLIWDEAIYAAVAETVVERGEVLFPHAPPLTKSKASYRPFFDKPPLAFWLQAIAMAVFGVGEFAARLPSATASILTGVLVYFVGRRRFSRLTGFVGGLIFLATPYLIYSMNGGRDGSTDTLLTLFGTLFVILTWRAIDERDDRLLLFAGVFGGLAVMVKGVAAGIFVFILAPLVIANWRYFLHVRSVKAGAVATALSLWWPLLAWYRYGDRFVTHFVNQQLQSRLQNSGPILEPFVSIAVASDGWYPWAMFAIGGFVVTLVDAYRGHNRETGLFIAWWAAIVPLFFGFQNSHPWYLIPMYVPGALLAAQLIKRVTDLDPLAIITHFAAAATALQTGFYINSYPPLPLIGFTVLVLGPIAVPFLYREVKRTGTPREITMTRVAATALVATILVAGFVGGVCTCDTGGEQYLAKKVNQKLDGDDVLYAHSYQAYPLNTFAFYVEVPVEKRRITALPARSVYALYPKPVVANTSRPHRIISVRMGASHNLAFIKISNRTV